MKIKCPSCEQKLKAAEKYIGKKVRCPKCKEPFTVPRVGVESAEEYSSAESLEQTAGPRIPLDTSLVTMFRANPMIVLGPIFTFLWAINGAMVGAAGLLSTLFRQDVLRFFASSEKTGIRRSIEPGPSAYSSRLPLWPCWEQVS